MKKNVKIDENYYLVGQTVSNEVTVEVAKKVNHIYIVDISGSMSSDLPTLRTQLKNKLSSMMNDGDTITLIWFSGRNDSGIMIEEMEVHSAKTLDNLHKAIDKWLHPIGLTAFLNPLKLTKEVIERISKNRPNSVFSLIFLTDGCNNDSPWNEVISTLKTLESNLAAATFVEFGYYADAQKLTQMASLVGGEKVSTRNFDDFEPIFHKKLSTPLMGGKKTVVEITDRYLYDFAFAVGQDGSVLLYNIVDNKIMVGADVKEVYYFTPYTVGVSYDSMPIEMLYAATYVLADKLMNDDAEKLLYVLGDQYYYQMLSNAFGKQKLNAFKETIKECVTDMAKRYPQGKGAIQKVDENAYCLMNLIADLGTMEDVLFYPNHPEFDYHRVSRQRIAKGSNLSEADQKRLAEAKTVDEANAILEELKSTNVDVKFVDTDRTKGYPIRDLVWNEERANLSVRIKIDGKVILPTNQWNLAEVPSYRYNTYTLIKDGIVNVAKLPVSYSSELVSLLAYNKVAYKQESDITQPMSTWRLIIDLASLPLINKGMVKSISADSLANQEWELLKLQASAKVFDYYRKSLFPKESKTYIEQYGQECADWLKEIGVTDYNGYSPKTDAAESTDFYMSVNLVTKIKGVSSLPKVEDVETKIINSTVAIKSEADVMSWKLSERLMVPAIVEFLDQLNSPIMQTLSEDEKKTVLQKYLTKKSSEMIKQKRGIMQQIAQIKFALILSKKWFMEFKSFDDNKLSKTFDGVPVEFTFDMVEKEVKI